MSYIKANHSKFEATATAMESYVSEHKRKMVTLGNTVTGLSQNWQGQDYTQFKTQWNKVVAKDSTSQKMIQAMENYCKFLRFAAGKYKEGQINAVNRANGIPKI